MGRFYNICQRLHTELKALPIGCDPNLKVAEVSAAVLRYILLTSSTMKDVTLSRAKHYFCTDTQ